MTIRIIKYIVYAIFASLLLISIALISLFLFKTKNQKQEEVIDPGTFLSGTENFSNGYGNLSDDGTYFRAIVTLNNVYVSDGRVFADVVWKGEEIKKQTIVIGNPGELNYIFVTKQFTRELYPESSKMQTIQVESRNLKPVLETYINQNVILGINTASPINRNELEEKIQKYIDALEPYFECNKEFSDAFVKGQSVDCRPFVHTIYVVQN